MIIGNSVKTVNLSDLVNKQWNNVAPMNNARHYIKICTYTELVEQ